MLRMCKVLRTDTRLLLFLDTVRFLGPLKFFLVQVRKDASHLRGDVFWPWRNMQILVGREDHNDHQCYIRPLSIFYSFVTSCPFLHSASRR